MNKKAKSFPLPLSRVMGRSSFERQVRTSAERPGSPSAVGMGAMKNPVQTAGGKVQTVMPEVARHKVPVSRSLQSMVERLAMAGIRDKVVLAAIGQVPRHLFVDPGLSGQAYSDVALPIGAHQTISKPSTVAKMMEALRMGQDAPLMQKILEIGTGCGYQAAILAKIAKEVYSVERIKSLHALARHNLRSLRIANLRLHYGDGMLGLPQVAPFDGIIIAAAGLEIPDALFDQLAVGGRLIAPVGGEQQTLQLVRRVAKNKWERMVVDDCHFVPLRGGTI